MSGDVVVGQVSVESADGSDNGRDGAGEAVPDGGSVSEVKFQHNDFILADLERFRSLEQLAQSLLQAKAHLVLADWIRGDLLEPRVQALVSAVLKQEQDRIWLGQGLWCGVPVYRDGAVLGVILFLGDGRRPVPDEAQRALILHLAQVAADVMAGALCRKQNLELRQMLDMIEDMSGVGWWRVDREGNSTTWSKRVYEIHGVEPGEEDLITVDEGVGFYHPQDQMMLEAGIQNALENGEGYSLRLRLNRRDGEQRVVISRSGTEMGDSGEVRGLFGVFRDVTDEEALLSKLRRNEARYRLLAENVSDVITRVKMNGSSKYISPAIKTMLGWTLEEMSGQSTDYVYAEDRPKVLEAIKQAVKAGEATRLEHRAVHRDGRILWVECTFKAVRDELGEIDDVVVVIRDVTERKTLEAAVMEAKERAEFAARVKTEFLANMSHELRTPLTSVIGYSGLLKTAEGLTPEQRLYADRIGASSETLLMVINDILDYSKLEADAVEIEKAAFDPRSHLMDTVGIIESQCQAKGLELSVELDPRLPEILSGDASRLRQVTLNFLSNAVKFTAAGKVSLKCFGAEMADGRFRLRLEVKDTGIGLSPEKGNEIFKRFTQADASTTRVYGGTGLGLAISRRLIELMNGRIGYESEPGKGTTFWYEVPLDFDFALPVSVQVDTEAPLGVPARVLMVDDAEANRELVSIILGSLGLEVETASNGVEAVAAVRQQAFDLVLMDVHMPEMDGLAATREIRRLEGDKHLPILALTANVGEDQMQRCLDAGMDGHLAKPIQVSELVQTLKAILDPD